MLKRVDKENKQSMISLFTSLMSMLFNICIGFFISPVIVRDLGVEANGFTQLANNFVSYASLLTIAINAMAARFTAVAYHKGETDKAEKYYSSALVANIFVILILLLPASILIMNLQNVLTIQTTRVLDVQILFGFTFLSFFCSNIQSVLHIATTVKNKQYLANILAMVGNAIRILILVILFSCFELHIYYVSMAAGIVAIMMIVGHYAIKQAIMADVHFRIKSFELRAMKEMLASGVWSLVNKCGDLLMTGFDLLLTNILIGSIEMGVLSVAKTIPLNLISLASMLSWNWNPKMMKEFARGDIPQMLRTLDLSAKVSTIIVSIPTIAFCVFAPEFYHLWMPTQDAKMLTILSFLSLLAYTMLAGTSSVYNIFSITNKLKFNSITYIVGAVISIAISVGFVKYTSIGIYAVAGVSSVIVILRNLLCLLPYAARVIGQKWYVFYKYVFLNAGCSLIVAAVAFAVKTIMPMNNWFMFLLACAITGILSAGIMIVVVMRKDQRTVLLSRFLKNR